MGKGTNISLVSVVKRRHGRDEKFSLEQSRVGEGGGGKGENISLVSIVQILQTKRGEGWGRGGGRGLGKERRGKSGCVWHKATRSGQTATGGTDAVKDSFRASRFWETGLA